MAKEETCDAPHCSTNHPVFTTSRRRWTEWQASPKEERRPSTPAWVGEPIANKEESTKYFDGTDDSKSRRRSSEPTKKNTTNKYP